MISREQMRDAARAVKLKREQMTIPELGGVVWISAISAKTQDRLEERFRIKHGSRRGEFDLRNFRGMRASYGIVNEQGARVLTDDDAQWLSDLPSGVLDKVLTKMTELSGGTEEEQDEMGKGSESPEASVVPFSNSRSASGG